MALCTAHEGTQLSFSVLERTAGRVLERSVDLIHVHPRPFPRWIDEGRLDALRTSQRMGPLLVPRDAVDDFLTPAGTLVREGGKRKRGS